MILPRLQDCWAVARASGTFAVIERSEDRNSVLMLLDNEMEAEAIAIELRKRGLRVEVRQGPSS